MWYVEYTVPSLRLIFLLREDRNPSPFFGSHRSITKESAVACCGMMMMMMIRTTREWRTTYCGRFGRVVLVVVVLGLGAPNQVTDAFGCIRTHQNKPLLRIPIRSVDFAAAAAAAAANQAAASCSSSGSSRRRIPRCGSLSASSAPSSDHNDDVGLTDTDTAANISNNNDDDVDFTTASEDDDSKLLSTFTIPSVATILQFAVPATGVWLCSPLLSLVDTSTVGLLAGTAAQAALNPATAITDYSARTMSFLYVATTNMVATSSRGGGTEGQQQDGKGTSENRSNSSINNDTTTTTTRVLGALRLSLFVGAALGACLFLGAGPLLRLLIGVDTSHALDPAIFASALRYVRIRALGMPAAALIGTAQSACLGLQDARSPLQLILAASGVNLVLDVLLVGHPNAWVGGAAGAAWATIVSQYVAIGLFFRYLGQSGGGGTVDETDAPKPLHTRGLLAGKLSLRNLFRRPDTKTTALFAPYVVPVTTTQVGRCSTYIAMGHVVSSSLGAVSMAANQIITAIFYTLIPIADSLSLTAQSFLPSVVAQTPSRERSAALRGTTRNLLKVAGLLGVLLAGIVACIPMGCRLFTTDAAVTALVRRIVPVLFVIFSLHGVFCGSEGILLAEKDLTFLGRMYAVYFTVVPYLMLRLKTAAKKGSSNVDLTSVWNLFLAYQLVRITVWVGRVAWLQRRGKQQLHQSDKNRAPTAVR